MFRYTSLVAIIFLSFPQFYPTRCCHSLFYIDLPTWRKSDLIGLGREVRAGFYRYIICRYNPYAVLKNNRQQRVLASYNGGCFDI
jgi:hypothetical protein